jgi:hypothetical protein
MNIKDLAQNAHHNAIAKGFWAGSQNVPEKLMLCVSELSEALEVLRNGVRANEVWTAENGKPEGFVVELADCILRCLDLAEHIAPGRIGDVLALKHEYNKGRPHMHGKQI